MAWEMFDRDGAGGVQICGLDGDSIDEAPVSSLPLACEISVRAESASPAALEATEADLGRITSALSGRIVATARTRTSLVVLAYLPSDDDADRYTRIALPRGASVSVAPAIDPEWTLFDAARPSGIEEQSMLDFRVRTQLHDAGDIGGQRPIEHLVVDLTKATIEGFMASVTAAIPLIEVTGGDGDLSSWRVTHPGDPNHVTESSWIIRQVAERHGASYGGWDCAVVSTPARATATRRWFRRS